MAANIWQNLELQLSEIELLQSMYPGEKELKIDDQELLDIQDFCSGRTHKVPNGLNFTLTIQLDDDDKKVEESNSAHREHVIELACYFPQEYPGVKADLFVRTQILSRETQKQLNNDLTSHISTLDYGDLCTLPAIQWIKENAVSYIERCLNEVHSLSAKSSTEENGCKTNTRGLFLRMWLYMHHIYSKTKRKDILQWASDHDLTGFCLPGKPGVVCLEGDEYNVEEYFGRLRRLNWKKITCRHRETGLQNIGVDEQRKFQGFDELFFEVHGTRESHMDMGQFLHYLEKHNLGYMFQILFGIEGKPTDSPRGSL